MPSITMRTEHNEADASRFRAVAGSHQAVGRTMGAALDALTADWGDDIQETAVFIQRFQPDAYFTAAQYCRMQELLARRATLTAEEARRTGSPHRRGAGCYYRLYREPHRPHQPCTRGTLLWPNAQKFSVSRRSVVQR